jgi:hypothetical protein
MCKFVNSQKLSWKEKANYNSVAKKQKRKEKQGLTRQENNFVQHILIYTCDG